jgi:hypothetical protein
MPVYSLHGSVLFYPIKFVAELMYSFAPYFCRSEMLRKLLNVVLEKDIEDQLDQSFEK